MDNYEQHHKNLANEDLVRIIYFERKKIVKEARTSAKKILDKRGLSAQELESIKKDIRNRKKEERAALRQNKDRKVGLLDWILNLLS